MRVFPSFVKWFLLLISATSAFPKAARAADLIPVLQDITPGWQSVTGEKYTFINRGEFIDIYDNKSRVLFRSIQVSMDEGAGKGSAYKFAVSADENHVQATIWVQHVGDFLATYEVTTGNQVEMTPITARESGGGADDFNHEATLLPPVVEPRNIARFVSAPEKFLDRTSFVATERGGDGDLRIIDVSLLRCDRESTSPEYGNSLVSSPSVGVDLHAETPQLVRSFPLT